MLIDSEAIDFHTSGDASFGTCADDSELFVECEAPHAEPTFQTQPVAIPPELICTATRDKSGVAAIVDTTAAELASVLIAIGQSPAEEASTLGKRCDKMKYSMVFATDGEPPTVDEAMICSCGIILCGCG